jgi:hypothetical protein
LTQQHEATLRAWNCTSWGLSLLAVNLTCKQLNGSQKLSTLCPEPSQLGSVTCVFRTHDGPQGGSRLGCENDFRHVIFFQLKDETEFDKL